MKLHVTGGAVFRPVKPGVKSVISRYFGVKVLSVSFRAIRRCPWFCNRSDFREFCEKSKPAVNKDILDRSKRVGRINKSSELSNKYGIFKTFSKTFLLARKVSIQYVFQVLKAKIAFFNFGSHYSDATFVIWP